MKCLFVYITVPDRRTGRQLAKALVEQHVAACVNLVGPIESFFYWQGALEQAREWVLVAKTTARRWPALVKTVRSLHPYECPCIVAWPLERGWRPFLSWIAVSVQHHQRPTR